MRNIEYFASIRAGPPPRLGKPAKSKDRSAAPDLGGPGPPVPFALDIGSNSVKRAFWFFRGGGVGQEIVEFWPPPGPARPWGEVGKGPGRGPARFTPIFSPADQFCSAELSHCLKVSDRRRNTLKSAQHRSESSCAGLRGYRAGYLGLEIQKWVRIVVCI